MFWNSSILEAWIFPIRRFTAAFPAEQVWHLWVHHRCWQIFRWVPSTLCLVRSSGRLWDGTRAPHSQLLLQLPPSACCKTQSCSPAPNICNRKLRRAGVCCPTQNTQITRLLNCHFQASQWSRGSCMSLLLLPGICDSPLYPSGNLYYCFVNLDFLLVLSNLIAITAIVGRKREVQIYSVINMKRIWLILFLSEWVWDLVETT